MPASYLSRYMLGFLILLGIALPKITFAAGRVSGGKESSPCKRRLVSVRLVFQEHMHRRLAVASGTRPTARLCLGNDCARAPLLSVLFILHYEMQGGKMPSLEQSACLLRSAGVWS